MPATQVAKTTNPLAALPSMLAIRDLRRRVRRSLGNDYPTTATLNRLLALDPLAVLRCLRAALAPIYGAARDVWTIPALIEQLGTSLTRRALDMPPAEVGGTDPVRKLWLHAVTTAHAAKMLAQSVGVLDPDEAYLLGLLHDLPLWYELLDRRSPQTSGTGSANDWVRHLNLPSRIVNLLELARQQPFTVSPLEPTNAPALISAAETMAALADFWHPNDGEVHARELLAASFGKNEFLMARRLRHLVQATLQANGLDLSLPDPEFEPGAGEKLGLFPSKQTGDIAEVVLSVLGCSRSASYRGIVTAVTSAALRFMGFDRAWYVKWVRATGRLVVRAKADLSARHISTLVVEPTAMELSTLQRAFDADRPLLIRTGEEHSRGLLHLLGADEAMLVPLNREFAMPAILVLDRGVSLRPVQLEREQDMATTLGQTATLLNENLLLKRRRLRAQKFALTDPLTRLFNRTMGIRTLDQEIARSQRGNTPLTVLMVDIDNFKQVNDVYGHLRGDQALRATAEVLRKTVRRTDTLCRYGGEEFVIVLPETPPDDATILAARLFTAVEARGSEMQLPLTVSVGMATIRPADTVETLLQRADQALYASKSKGRNRFSVDVDSE
ncbi:MAG TPA: diguanylate cyclase [Planctomycetota bacterium]|nr:diguanylate cyclase [Planctomycetota bacterium]